MITTLNTAATGMAAQQKQLEVISNNLANADTTAFKKSRADFEDLLYNNMKEPGAATSATTKNPTGVQVGAGVKVVGTTREHNVGSLKPTNNELDVAIDGDGFFAVQRPNGEVAYTRDGSFKRSAEGRIETANGFPVVPEITIPDGTTALNISGDGRVSARAADGTVQELGQIQLTNFANSAGLQSIGANMYMVSPSSGAPNTLTPGEAGVGQLQQKFLEASNVNPVSEMTDMIRAQRVFELNSKVVGAADQMLGSLSQIR